MYGPIPDGLCVLHRCDVRACVRPDHLFLGTFADNVHDMVQKGRHDVMGSRRHPETRPKGEMHPSAKFTWEQVRDIRSRYATSGVSKLALAREFNVNYKTMWALLEGKTWKE